MVDISGSERKASGVPDLPRLFHFSGGFSGAVSEFRTSGLALLLLLGLVLRLGLIFLERLGDVLCSLVGQAVVVDRLLGLGLIGDLHTGIVERGGRALLFGIELEIDRAGLALLVNHVGHDDDLSLGVILLLLFGEGYARPFRDGLDPAVLGEPRRLLLSVGLLFLLLLPSGAAGHKLDTLAVCRHLKHDIVGLAVPVGYFLRRKRLAILELHDFGGGQFGVAYGVADEHILDRDGDYLVGRAVDAYE